MITTKLTRLIELHDKFSSVASELLSFCSQDDDTTKTMVEALLTITNVIDDEINKLQNKITVENYLNELNEQYFENRLN